MLKPFTAVMTSTQISLDKPCTIEFDGHLSVKFPSEFTQVDIKHTKNLSRSKATFTRTENKGPFMDRNGVTYHELDVPLGMQIRLKFGEEGSEIHVVGPGTVGAIGSKGYFRSRSGKADLTVPGRTTECEGFTVKEGSSYHEGVKTFEIKGGSAGKGPDLLTIELRDPQAPLDLVFGGEGLNIQSEVDLPHGHLDIWTGANGSNVNVVAESINMRSTSGALKAQGSQFGTYDMQTISGPVYAPANPTGRGTIGTDTGPIFADAPRASESGKKKNTLAISTRGTAHLNVPTGYEGSVDCGWKSGWGRCTVDGRQQKGGHYEESGG
jgi:hypothetical protein